MIYQIELTPDDEQNLLIADGRPFAHVVDALKLLWANQAAVASLKDASAKLADLDPQTQAALITSFKAGVDAALDKVK